MTKFYKPEDQKYYTEATAQSVLKLSGINADNCEQFGLFVVGERFPPKTTLAQKAVKNALPTLVNGKYIIEWTVTDVPATSEIVNQERDHRISAGFTWNGHTFQSDSDSRENIIGSSVDATEFMRGGGAPNEVYWQSSATPFVWLAADNTPVAITPAQMIDMGRALLSHKKNCIFAARVLKDMEPIPADFADDKYWP